MSLILQADPLPLQEDEHGTIRVRNTCVLLELIVHAYQNGCGAEEIARRFDTLDLADVHAVLAYYLRRRQAVEDYMSRREAEAEAIRRTIEAALPRKVSAEELKVRWAARQER